MCIFFEMCMTHVATERGLQCRDTDRGDVGPTDACRTGRHMRVTAPDDGNACAAAPTETPHG